MVNGKTILLVLAVLFIWCVTMWIIMRNKITHIKNNWDKYRCKPWIIPFAKQINPCVDAIENAKLCSKEKMNKVVDNSIGPVLNVFSSITGSALSLASDATNMSKSQEGGGNFVMSIVDSILAKLGGVGDVIRYILIKIRAILNKFLGIIQVGYNIVVGIGLSLTWIWKIPVTVFCIALMVLIIICIALKFFMWWYLIILMVVVGILGGLGAVGAFGGGGGGGDIYGGITSEGIVCFDGSTKIVLNNGSTKSIKDIKTGDCLQNNNRVLETMIFKAPDVMYNYHNVIVSGSHLVYHSPSQSWKYVEDCRESIKIENYTKPFIYCLATENNTIPTCQLGEEILFTDFHETSALEKHYHLFTLYYYNHILNKSNSLDLEMDIEKIGLNSDTEEYGLGLNTILDTIHGIKKITDIKIGDKLDTEDNIVIGIISSWSDRWYYYKGIHCSSRTQKFIDCQNKVDFIDHPIVINRTMPSLHLLTSKNYIKVCPGSGMDGQMNITLLDYQELPDHIMRFTIGEWYRDYLNSREKEKTNKME